MAERAGEQRVEAVERALTILEAFADGSRALALAELTRRTGYYRSTVLRLAASLERFGYLHRDDDGRFRLGASLLRLGVLYQSAFDLAAYVRPALARIVERTEETAAFYIREGDRRICLYRHHSPRLIRHHLVEGAELTLEQGAGARVLMAFTGAPGALYDEVRRAGHYVSMGERDPQTASVAVPVFADGGRFVGAIAVVGLLMDFDAGHVDDVRAVLGAEAARLGRGLGRR